LNSQDIGIVYNELRSKRVLYGGPVPGRRRDEREKEAVNILRACAGRYGDLEDFLTTQGLKLIIKDAQALGLPGSHEIYIAVRNPLAIPPQHLCGDQLIGALTDSRREETSEQTAIWSTFLIMLLLNLIYTQDRRPIGAISQFKDSIVDTEDLLELAQKKIEALRGSPFPTSTRQATIIQTLTSLSEQRLEGRIRAFLRAAVDLGILEKAEAQDSVYRQTLWSAVDLAENFRRYAPHLLVDDIQEQVDVIGSLPKPYDDATHFDDDDYHDDIDDDEAEANGLDLESED
jgi:hypothetical protein